MASEKKISPKVRSDRFEWDEGDLVVLTPEQIAVEEAKNKAEKEKAKG